MRQEAAPSWPAPAHDQGNNSGAAQYKATHASRLQPRGDRPPRTTPIRTHLPSLRLHACVVVGDRLDGAQDDPPRPSLQRN